MLALPALWWEPLHLDEAITIAYADRSYGSIVRDVFIERGGAPVHFFVEHVTLAAPGGIEGLRLPSLVFFLLSLVLASWLARRAGGRGSRAARTGPARGGAARHLARHLRADVLPVRRRGARNDAPCAPRRSHGRAPRLDPGRSGRRRARLRAPDRSSLQRARRRHRSARRRTQPACAPARSVARRRVAVAVAAPYAYALAVLRSRYDVGFESGRLRTTAGRSVPEEALYALTPGGDARSDRAARTRARGPGLAGAAPSAVRCRVGALDRRARPLLRPDPGGHALLRPLPRPRRAGLLHPRRRGLPGDRRAPARCRAVASRPASSRSRSPSGSTAWTRSGSSACAISWRR